MPPAGPAQLQTIVADLAQPDSFDRIVAEVMQRHGRIDVLVNNAGIGQASVRADQRRQPIRFWEATPEQWNRFVAVNATAPIMMTRAVLPHMLRAKRGRIITVTTSLGTMVRRRLPAVRRQQGGGGGGDGRAVGRSGGHRGDVATCWCRAG